MAATVEIQEANGSPAVWTTVSTARFCSADVYNPGNNYSIPIPNTGFRYSYWKTFCLLISGIGTSVSNIRFYSDGSIGWYFGTGGGLYIGTKNSGDSGIAVEDYAEATGTEGLTGNWMGDSVNGHAIYKQAGYTVERVSSYTMLAPLVIDSDNHTSDGRSKAIVLQVKVDTVANGASQGIQADETLYFRYDEI